MEASLQRTPDAEDTSAENQDSGRNNDSAADDWIEPGSIQQLKNNKSGKDGIGAELIKMNPKKRLASADNPNLRGDKLEYEN